MYVVYVYHSEIFSWPLHAYATKSLEFLSKKFFVLTLALNFVFFRNKTGPINESIDDAIACQIKWCLLHHSFTRYVEHVGPHCVIHCIYLYTSWIYVNNLTTQHIHFVFANIIDNALSWYLLLQVLFSAWN